MSQGELGHVSHMNESCSTFERVMSQIWMCYVPHENLGHVSHMNESCPIYERVMSHM